MIQWERMAEFIARRREIASRYYRAFADLPIAAPNPELLTGHVFYRYIVTIKRDSVQFLNFCREQGVQAERPVGPKALHQWLKRPPGNYPVSEEAMSTLVSIPIYPSLKDRDETKIKEVVREAAQRL
jgi:dTDP-4-amino-4,6-dideoxygalactose transaminase